MTRHKVFTNKLKPATPCVYLYDSQGGQSFDATGQFHTWDSTKIITQHFNYPSNKDRIILEVNSSGLFMLQFDCSFTSHEKDICSIATSIYKNGIQEEGTTCYTTVTINYDYSISLNTILYLEKGDYIQVFTQTNQVDAITSIGNTSRLIVTYLPMQGWNNSTGGRIEYKGGVLR